jgi:hypothetical protein
MDDFFRTQQSPRGEPQVSGAFVSPPRNGPLLPRRFTTDSGRVPTLSSITTIPRAAEPQDFASTTVRVRMLEQGAAAPMCGLGVAGADIDWNRLCIKFNWYVLLSTRRPPSCLALRWGCGNRRRGMEVIWRGILGACRGYSPWTCALDETVS